MNSSFAQLFLMNMKFLYRNPSGVFFSIVLPLGLYIGLSVLPIGSVLQGTVNYSHYILPGIIAMVIMQSGIYTLAYYMIDLRARNVIKRFLATPIKPSEWVLSLLCARVLVILIQVVALTLLGVLFFGAPFAGNVFSVLAFSLIGGFIFLLGGLIISTLAKSYEAAAPITAAVGLPLMFLGNIFYPIETLPHGLQLVAKFLPTTYLASGLRDLYINPVNAVSFIQNFWPLLIWLGAMLLLVLWRFKLSEK